MILGIDFDNTIINYDRLIYQIALERGLIDQTQDKNKKSIRDAIRKLPDGEQSWQSIQGIIYGQRVCDADVQVGFLSFFEAAQNKFDRIYIISHKTETSPFDPTKSNLRKSAVDWMKKNGFFSFPNFGLDRVFFASTKEEKIKIISDLKCDVFIDDLEEIFVHQDFPKSVKKILFNKFPPKTDEKILHLRTWDEIQCLF